LNFLNLNYSFSNVSLYDNCYLFVIFALFDFCFKIINYYCLNRRVNILCYNNLQKRHFNLFRRQIKWYLGISYFGAIYYNHIEKYKEPFIRDREWDIFFRDFGPMIENKAYLNSYLYKLDTVREGPLLWDIQLVIINSLQISNIIDIVKQTDEERDRKRRLYFKRYIREWHD